MQAPLLRGGLWRAGKGLREHEFGERGAGAGEFPATGRLVVGEDGERRLQERTTGIGAGDLGKDHGRVVRQEQKVADDLFEGEELVRFEVVRLRWRGGVGDEAVHGRRRLRPRP